MAELPTYYAWQPRLEKKDVLSILLTKGTETRTPFGGPEFFDAVVSAAGVTASVLDCRAEPFLSSYFTGNTWEECWNVIFLVEGDVAFSNHEVSGVGIYKTPEYYKEPKSRLPLRVCADFARRRAAEECRKELRERPFSPRLDEPPYVRYMLHRIHPHTYQLLVDVLTIERSRVEEFNYRARDVIATCEKHGGRTRGARSLENGD